MEIKINKITTPKGKVKYEFRAWSKTHQIKRRFNSKTEANKFKNEIQYQGSEGLQDLTNEATFRSELEYWLQVVAPNLAPSYQRNFPNYVREISEFFLDVKVNDLTPDVVRKYVSHLEAKGNSSKTIKNKMVFIKAILNQSVKDSRIRSHQLNTFRLKKDQKTDVRIWTESEAESFLKFADNRYPHQSKDRWIYSVYLLTLNTGLRNGEVWGLRASDFRWDDGVIEVSRQLEATTRTLGPLKGRRSRRVPLTNEVREEMIDFLKDKDPIDFVFLKGNEPIRRSTFDWIFRKDLRLWGGPKISFHSLRKSSATIMLRNGISIDVIKKILGHTDIRTTQIYLGTDDEDIRAVAKNFSIGSLSNSCQIHELKR